MIRASSTLVKGEGVSTAEGAAKAVARDLGKTTVAFLFASGQDPEDLEEIVEATRDALEGAPVIGCTGGGVVGTGEEVEGEAAIALVAVETDEQVSVEPVFAKLAGDGARDGDAVSAKLGGKIRGSAERAAFVLLADPMSFDAKPLLARLREKQPKLPVIGGLSAARGDSMPVFAGEEHSTRALAGAVLSGPGLKTTVAVAQGCRPIGRSGRVTRADKNLLYEVDGEPVLVRLKEAIEAAEGRALFCGLGYESLRMPSMSDDYLARNILGVEPKAGAVAIAEVIPPGSTMSFLVRDAEAAREDLAARVRELRSAFTKKPPAFGLYFDCLGRGAGLYDEEGVDAGIIKDALGDFPLAGFFGNGELAPFLGTNLLHNYTGALVLFGEA